MLKYNNFRDIFSLYLTVELQKYIKINNYAIELIDDEQLFYKLINSLQLVELEILKIYIKTMLVNNFISF